MKLISWNVNSLRSCEEKFLDFVSREQPDIIMIQELRAFPRDLSFSLQIVDGYEAVFNPSERPGYSGTAMYYKKELGIESIKTQVGDSHLDIEGRMIITEKAGEAIINFYTPNGTRNDERLQYKLRFYEAATILVKSYLDQKMNVILGGDFNVAHTEIDLYSPKTNARHSGFLPAERKWFGDMLNMGFADSFRLFEKSGGHYSWWHMRDPKRELNRGWRFDYFLVSQNLVPKVKRAQILREIYGSDHCPILLEVLN